MKCQEAAEYVSALCDGETIPRTAAEHIGVCAMCRARLHEYLEMGAELRRVASLAPAQELRPRSWAKPQKTSTWWSKGVETMRIPRFAFALLLLAIVGLGSGLVMVKARAQNQGAVLMLTAKTAPGATVRCALSLWDKKKASCGSTGPQHLLGFRVASVHGDEIELGVRAKAEHTPPFGPSRMVSPQEIKNLPEKLYVFRPGQQLKINIPGSGRMVVTGDLLDHMPPLLGMDVQTDPDANELQVVSPILIRGKEVLFDFKGGSAIHMPFGVDIYLPGSGLWTLSLRPLEGAVEAKVEQNRVSFELEGQSYTLTTGAPVARSERIWVRHNGNFRPEGSPQYPFIGGADVGQVPK